MRVNQNTVIKGERVTLVPYRREHVVIYHQWMQDPYLQLSTASEPLSLEEEYAMQESWAQDADKCTFILLDPSFPSDVPESGRHGGAMAGDVNLFFNDHEDKHTAEIEVMIAAERSRRKGLAKEALMLFMAYAVSSLGVKKFVAKIGQGNMASIALFTGLGFRETSHSEVFKEITLSLPVEGGIEEGLEEVAKKLDMACYD